MKPHGRKWRFEDAVTQPGGWDRRPSHWAHIGYRKRMKV